MKQRQKTASDFSADQTARVIQACVAVLDALREMSNDLTVVGGLVPTLLIDVRASHDSPHIGTTDVDVSLALRDDCIYSRAANILIGVGFDKPSTTSEGVRWTRHLSHQNDVILDLLPVPATEDETIPAAVAGLEPHFWKPLRMAFADRLQREITHSNFQGQTKTVCANICGPGAFLAIKALTYRRRNLDKDAYDLVYVLRNFGRSAADIFPYLAPLMSKFSEARQALDILEHDFANPNDDGPLAVARFLYQRPDDNLQADIAGDVRSLLRCFGDA